MLEGIDGTGKSTISYMLSKYVHTDSTWEPHNEWYKTKIQRSKNVYERSLLFAADRAAHVTLIEAGLKHHNVVCDRGPLSNIVYQYYEFCVHSDSNDRIREEFLNWLINIQPPLPVCSHTFLLVCDPEVAVQRCINKGEVEHPHRLDILQSLYFKFCPANSTTLNTEQLSADEICSIILNYIKMGTVVI
jgi:thymidylate kinase